MPVGGDPVGFSQQVKGVACIIIAHIFSSKVVNDKAKHSWSPLVPPKSRSVWERVVVVISKALVETMFFHC